VLRLLEVEEALPRLEGVAMELEDCAFPLLADVELTADPAVAFDGASWALLVGAFPRQKDMTRADLIFGPQGRAIAGHAAADVRILVVGNPCNTNCLIARAHAMTVPAERWFAMTRLDENRARSQLAKKAGVPVAQVTNMTIWGNHSGTQYPDVAHARIGGWPAPEVIADPAWLEGNFIQSIQGRGEAIIKARGTSSAASAAQAILDSVNAIHAGTPEGDWTSLAVVSRGEYGVPEGLVFSYPVRSDGTSWQVVEGLEHDAAATARLKTTTDELLDERALAQEKGLLPS
jgi:malate dehydrogenase